MNRPSLLLKKLSFLMIGIAFGLCVQPSWAQELPEDERGTFTFDIDVNRFLESELAKSVEPDVISKLAGIREMFGTVDLADVKRFSGTFEFSETWESVDLGGMEDKDFPLDFCVQVVFKSEDMILKIEEEMQDNSNKYEENGNTYYGPPDSDGGPTNIRLSLSGKTLEMGTKKYMYHSERNVLTKELNEAWEKLPEDTVVRAAIDIEASRPVIDGFLELFESELAFDPTMQMIVQTTLQFIDDTNMASGYFDLDREKVLSLNLVGSNAEANKKIEGVVNGLLFMGALPLKNGINMIPFQGEDDAKPLLALVDQLKAERKGENVLVDVTKPKGFDDTARTVYYPQLSQWASTYQVRTDLQAVASAAVNYSFSNNELMPFLVDPESEQSSELSWRVRVLKHGYTGNMYIIGQKADLMESWQHENNQEIADSMPAAFGKGNQSNIVWVKTKVQKRQDVTDPHDQTIMLIYLPKATDNNWMQPGDHISMIKVIQMVSKLEDGEQLFAATYAGSIITMDNSWDHKRVKSHLTPAGGDNN